MEKTAMLHKQKGLILALFAAGILFIRITISCMQKTLKVKKMK